MDFKRILDPMRCRYSDCKEGHPVASEDGSITCQTCRECMGLPRLCTDHDPCEVCAYRMSEGLDWRGCGNRHDGPHVRLWKVITHNGAL